MAWSMKCDMVVWVCWVGGWGMEGIANNPAPNIGAGLLNDDRLSGLCHKYYTANELPQPQEEEALGLLKVNPRLFRPLR